MYRSVALQLDHVHLRVELVQDLSATAAWGSTVLRGYGDGQEFPGLKARSNSVTDSCGFSTGATWVASIFDVTALDDADLACLLVLKQKGSADLVVGVGAVGFLHSLQALLI